MEGEEGVVAGVDCKADNSLGGMEFIIPICDGTEAAVPMEEILSEEGGGISIPSGFELDLCLEVTFVPPLEIVPAALRCRTKFEGA